jgi:hypothetical protein
VVRAGKDKGRTGEGTGLAADGGSALGMILETPFYRRSLVNLVKVLTTNPTLDWRRRMATGQIYFHKWKQNL